MAQSKNLQWFPGSSAVAEGGLGSGRHAGEMSAKAEAASKSAGNTHGGQIKAVEAHNAAGTAHEKAASAIHDKAPTAANMKEAAKHTDAAKAHFAKADSHLAVARNMAATSRSVKAPEAKFSSASKSSSFHQFGGADHGLKTGRGWR